MSWTASDYITWEPAKPFLRILELIYTQNPSTITDHSDLYHGIQHPIFDSHESYKWSITHKCLNFIYKKGIKNLVIWLYFHQLSFSRHRSFQSFLSSVLCGLVHCRLEHLFPISFPFPLSHIHQGTEQGNQTGESVQAILHHTEGHSRASPQIFKCVCVCVWGGGLWR